MNNSLLSRIYARNNLTILFVMILLVLFFGVTAKGFFSVISFSNIITTSSLLLLVALGETLVMISAGIDLSLGAMVGLSGMASGAFMSAQYHGGSGTGIMLIGLVIALLTGLVGGFINGAVISFLKINPLIVTLGLYGVFSGAAELISGGIPINGFPNALVTLGIQGPFVPYFVWITVIVTVVLGWFMKRVPFGRYVYAVGADREAVRRAGINLNRHTVWLYGIAGLLGGLAGFFSNAHFQTASPSAGSEYLLIAVSAVVIGGVPLSGGEGTVWGTVIGALVIGVLQNGFVMLNISAFWQLIAVGITTIIAVYFDEMQQKSRLAAAKSLSNAEREAAQSETPSDVQNVSKSI